MSVDGCIGGFQEPVTDLLPAGLDLFHEGGVFHKVGHPGVVDVVVGGLCGGPAVVALNVAFVVSESHVKVPDGTEGELAAFGFVEVAAAVEGHFGVVGEFRDDEPVDEIVNVNVLLIAGASHHGLLGLFYVVFDVHHVRVIGGCNFRLLYEESDDNIRVEIVPVPHVGLRVVPANLN